MNKQKLEYGDYRGIISTYSGQHFDLINPNESMVKAIDISKGLSHICHYGGQIETFFSVAQHSIMVFNLAREHGESDYLQRVALIHDAPEAYIGDCMKPLKLLLPDYQEVEKRIEKVVFSKFRLDPAAIQEIKKYDKMVIHKEYNSFFAPFTDSIKIMPIYKAFNYYHSLLYKMFSPYVDL